MWCSCQHPHDHGEVVEVSHGCQGEVGVAFDGARLAGCGLKHHAGCGAGECEDHVFDVVDGFEPADGEEVEGCVGGMFESGLREVGIVVDVRVDAAAAIEKFRGVARNGVRGTGMRGDWPVLLQALHADGGVDGYGQFEFLGIDVIIRVHADGQSGVGTAGTSEFTVNPIQWKLQKNWQTIL